MFSVHVTVWSRYDNVLTLLIFVFRGLSLNEILCCFLLKVDRLIQWKHEDFPYIFFIDNFFTTLPQLIEMKYRGYQCIGTIKSNRGRKNFILTDCKTFNKKQRGSIEAAVDILMTARWCFLREGRITL